MPRLSVSRLIPACALLSLAFLASCSSFDQRWEAIKPDNMANPSAPLSGKWEGTWQSDATSYSGHMQAIITPLGKTVQDKITVQQYAASFRVRLFEVGFDEYTVTLNATKQPDGKIHFEGKKDLGYFKGGIVRYDGFVDPEKDLFFCDYNSDKDQGTFKMRLSTLENK